jgi:hypothetical protein
VQVSLRTCVLECLRGFMLLSKLAYVQSYLREVVLAF